jgi:hypothetical protein
MHLKKNIFPFILISRNIFSKLSYTWNCEEWPLVWCSVETARGSKVGVGSATPAILMCVLLFILPQVRNSRIIFYFLKEDFLVCSVLLDFSIDKKKPFFKFSSRNFAKIAKIFCHCLPQPFLSHRYFCKNENFREIFLLSLLYCQILKEFCHFHFRKQFSNHWEK